MPRKKTKAKRTVLVLDDEEVIHVPKGSAFIPAEKMAEFNKWLKTLPKKQRDEIEDALFVFPQAVVSLTEDEHKELDPDYKRPTKH